MAKSGLEEFREVITDVKNLSSWGVKSAVAAPLADFVLRVGAPWPTGVPIITSIVELISLICVFQLWSRKTQKQLTRRMAISLTVLIISFFSYLYLFGSYTFINPATSRRYAKGFVIRPDIQSLIPKEFSSPAEALSGSEYKEEEVWTASSITAARLTLLAAWLFVFGSLSVFLGTFVIAQRRRTVRGRAPDEAPPQIDHRPRTLTHLIGRREQ
jgi:hypothetical protein